MQDDQPLSPDPSLPASEPERANPQQPSADNGNIDTAKEQLSMLDVHPAHHAASTWREFFIHIATIAIGLLLAVGLEQTVEYVHHRRELTEVRRELAEEKRANIEVFRHGTASFRESGVYLKDYLATLRRSIKDPAVPLPALQVPVDFVFCQYTVWTTAQRDGSLTLMPAVEQSANDRMYVGLHTLDDAESQAYKSILQAGAVFASGPKPISPTLDFSGGMDPKDLTPEQKKQLYSDLSQSLVGVSGVEIVEEVTEEFNPEFGGPEDVPHNPEQAKPNPGTP